MFFSVFSSCEQWNTQQQSEMKALAIAYNALKDFKVLQGLAVELHILVTHRKLLQVTITIKKEILKWNYTHLNSNEISAVMKHTGA